MPNSTKRAQAADAEIGVIAGFLYDIECSVGFFIVQAGAAENLAQASQEIQGTTPNSAIGRT